MLNIKDGGKNKGCHGLLYTALSRRHISDLNLIPCQSVSDDSVDLGGSDKQPGAKSSKKLARQATVSWWQDDEHSDGGTGRGNNEERTLHDIISTTQVIFVFGTFRMRMYNI